MTVHSDFEFAAGSIIGREHRDVTKNCQDGFTVVQTDLCTVAIVADGCGSGTHSEVGAQLGVHLLATSICGEAAHRRSPALNWQRIRMDVLSQLHVLARGMGGDYREIVKSHFLFTVVGVVLAYDTATFFAIGDGVIMVNDEFIKLGPFPGNEPPYLAYGLLPGNVNIAPEDLEFRIVAQYPLDELKHFLIGSDGVLDLMRVSQEHMPGMSSKLVGDIDQFWAHDRYFDNEELVSRQLRLIGRDWPRRDPQPGLLPDDTALVVGRRRQQPSP